MRIVLKAVEKFQDLINSLIAAVMMVIMVIIWSRRWDVESA